MPEAGAVRAVRERVAAAADRAGRRADDVRIVAATKYSEAPAIARVVRAGICDLGENRAQRIPGLAAELSEASGAPRGLTWHYLGAVQTNKVRFLEAVSLVHGLQREREARALQAWAERHDRSWDVLVQVNVAGEASKQGVAPDEVDALLERIAAYPRVRPRGFTFVAPQAENPEDVRWVFTEGRRLRERYGSDGLTELSMGMTDDFEVAIEEGATIVRIGRALFGP